MCGIFYFNYYRKRIYKTLQFQKNTYKFPGDKAENYISPPTDYANSGMDPIDCAKANMYKPK